MNSSEREKRTLDQREKFIRAWRRVGVLEALVVNAASMFEILGNKIESFRGQLHSEVDPDPISVPSQLGFSIAALKEFEDSVRKEIGEVVKEMWARSGS